MLRGFEAVMMEAWRRYPFYAAVLSKLRWLHDASVSSMAVSFDGRDFFLHVSPSYFAAFPEFKLGILLHEVHHVVLGHLTRPALRADQVAAPDLLELAKEMSANEYLCEPLPSPVTCAPYASLGMKEGQSTLERYRLLLLHAKREPAAARRLPKGTLDDHGRHHTSTLPDQAGSEARLESLLRDAIETGATQGAGDSDLARHELLAGKEPGQWLELLNAEGYAALPFRDLLRRFVLGRSRTGRAYGRPNRRFWQHVGIVPGRARRQSSAGVSRLLVVIDTSASVRRAQLERVAVELRALRTHVAFEIIECDACIQRRYPFAGELHSAKGRGGTNLRPVFALPEVRARRVDGLLCFTDGMTPLPPKVPPVPVLWLLLGDNAKTPPWGISVKL